MHNRPGCYRNLWGGHLSLWTPGLLAYNVAMAGVDLSEAKFVRGSNEVFARLQPRRVQLTTDLTYDYADLHKLAKCMPDGPSDSSDPWNVSYHVGPNA